MLAEHLPDGRRFLRNVERILSPGGYYLQVSPVLFALPFLVNKILPNAATKPLLRVASSRDEFKHGKFPAMYSWCRGPSRTHLKRIENLGFEIEVARGYFGHSYYKRVGPLNALEIRKSAWLVDHPIPTLCSFSLLLLRKPLTT
jgi:hypothetical protein